LIFEGEGSRIVCGGNTMTVNNLLEELVIINDANSKETIYYNSDLAMARMGTHERVAALKSIHADSRWIDGLIASIDAAVSFVVINQKEASK